MSACPGMTGGCISDRYGKLMVVARFWIASSLRAAQ